MVERQFYSKIKVIRSDNVFELGTGKVHAEYLLKQGIVHQTTCVGTPNKMELLKESTSIFWKSQGLYYINHIYQ